MRAAGIAARNRTAWTERLRVRADENELTAYLWVAFNCTYNSPTDEAVETLIDGLPAWRDTPLIRFRDRDLHRAADTGTLGTVFMTAEDFERAAEFYDRALEVVPDYPEALLGKVRALTFAGRYSDALTATDALLVLEYWYIGDARYWRAMNEVQLEQDDAAWGDIERAAKLISNAEVPKLAGIIAVRRQQLLVARAKFEEAQQRDGSDCEGPFYLGTVLVEQQEWAPRDISPRYLGGAGGTSAGANREARTAARGAGEHARHFMV
jgi:tetratricopeptide (TPR) repeat protein